MDAVHSCSRFTAALGREVAGTLPTTLPKYVDTKKEGKRRERKKKRHFVLATSCHEGLASKRTKCPVPIPTLRYSTLVLVLAASSTVTNSSHGRDGAGGRTMDHALHRDRDWAAISCAPFLDTRCTGLVLRPTCPVPATMASSVSRPSADSVTSQAYHQNN